MTNRILRLTTRAHEGRANPIGCRLSILLTWNGRNIWGTVLNLPQTEDAVNRWLDRRLQAAGRMMAGEITADAIAELGGELAQPNPLPKAPAGP